MSPAFPTEAWLWLWQLELSPRAGAACASESTLVFSPPSTLKLLSCGFRSWQCLLALFGMMTQFVTLRSNDHLLTLLCWWGQCPDLITAWPGLWSLTPWFTKMKSSHTGSLSTEPQSQGCLSSSWDLPLSGPWTLLSNHFSSIPSLCYECLIPYKQDTVTHLLCHQFWFSLYNQLIRCNVKSIILCSQKYPS